MNDSAGMQLGTAKYNIFTELCHPTTDELQLAEKLRRPSRQSTSKHRRILFF
jgi:hypothetical protein